MGKGFRLGRLAGVDVQVDWSLLIVFLLITFSLGGALFPQWHPDWPSTLSWALAVAAAVLFFGSVLLHEFAHALVGRHHGAVVPRITLFVFGGISHMTREPRRWQGELWMAAVGPLTSLALGAICLLLAGMLAGALRIDPDAPQETFTALGPAPTLLLWLGQINILLGVFNLVPGFPLDGGRVLRALLWGATGNQLRATRWAAGMGQGIALLLIGMGLAMMLGLRVPIFGSGFIGGLWLVLIGWFLNNAATGSYQQLVLSRALGGVSVQRLLLTDLKSVEPDISVQRLADDYLLHTGQRAFPVLRDGAFLGLVCLADLRRLPAESRPLTRVDEIMTPLERLVSVGPDASAQDVFSALTDRGVNQVPVMDGERFVGMVTREGLLKWLSLSGDGAAASGALASRDEGR